MRARLLPALAAVLSLALALPASAYVIYLKGNQQVVAREKPVVQGKFLVFYTPLGAMQRIPLSDYDEKKTLEANTGGTGDAYVLGDVPGEKPATEGGAERPSLSEYIQTQKKRGIGEERKPVEVAREGKGIKAPPEVAQIDPQTEGTFLHTLDSYGVKGARVTAGAAGMVRVQGLAETEEQVFAALKGTAKALMESRTSSRPVAKADIYLSTSTGENAGHYEMSGDDAEAITSGRKTPVSWFMANVSL